MYIFLIFYIYIVLAILWFSIVSCPVKVINILQHTKVTLDSQPTPLTFKLLNDSGLFVAALHTSKRVRNVIPYQMDGQLCSTNDILVDDMIF